MIIYKKDIQDMVEQIVEPMIKQAKLDLLEELKSGCQRAP